MPNIGMWLGIMLSGIVAILSFFSHINALDTRQRAELGDLAVRLYDRESKLDDRASARYAELIGKVSSNSARIDANDRSLKGIIDLLKKDLELLNEGRTNPDKSGDRGE